LAPSPRIRLHAHVSDDVRPVEEHDSATSDAVLAE
jgi:hypothetical protein